MKNLKKLLGVLVLAAAFVILPKDVYAKDVNVAVRTGSFMSPTTVGTITLESGVSKISDLKAKLKTDYNYEDGSYVLWSGSEEYEDNAILCVTNMYCMTSMVGAPDEFDSITIYLVPVDTTAKKITLKSIKPTDESMFMNIREVNYEKFEGLQFVSSDEKFEKCTFFSHTEFKMYTNYTIEYDYNESVKKLAEDAIKNGLLDKTKFSLTDVEMLNYINYGGSLADYASSFKNQLENTNFTFRMDPRGGGYDPFGTHEIGFYMFLYDNALYGVKEFMEVSGEHIIYVPTDSTNVLQAIKDRLDTLFGEDNKLEVEESDDTINELLTAIGENAIEGGDVKYYIITSKREGTMNYNMPFFFKAVKDSSKINNKSPFASKDLVTNVSVSAGDGVPLDTVVGVQKITEGEAYEELMKKIDNKDSETYDITLYSNAQGRLVEKLENGKFLVSIPVSKELEGKNLVALYVKEDGTLEKHEVTIKNGYATFETDHFSVYTLASTGKIVANPSTGDNLIYFVSILMISALSLISALVIKKAKNN